jgi:hypothetical protein
VKIDVVGSPTSKPQGLDAAKATQGMPPPPAAEKTDCSGAAYVIGFRARECQGQAWRWSVLPWSIIPPPRQIQEIPQRAANWPPPMSERTLVVQLEPPSPPPRGAQRLFFAA